MRTKILVIAVVYEDAASAYALIARYRRDRTANIDLTMVDNSEGPLLDSDRLQEVTYVHYPDNPGYYGGAHRAIAQRLYGEREDDYDAVVVCNADLEFELQDICRSVQAKKTLDERCRWIIAPNLIESGYRYAGNPARKSRPDPFKRPRLFGLTDNFWLFGLYVVMSDIKRRIRRRPIDSDCATEPIYMAHGAFMIFGSGFIAAAGNIPNVPLTNEEYAVAEVAHHLGQPIWLDPTLVVRHARGVTTKNLRPRALRSRHDMFRKSAAFYESWSAIEAIDENATDRS